MNILRSSLFAVFMEKENAIDNLLFSIGFMNYDVYVCPERLCERFIKIEMFT